jgi:hypothetical protein
MSVIGKLQSNLISEKEEEDEEEEEEEVMAVVVGGYCFCTSLKFRIKEPEGC